MKVLAIDHGEKRIGLALSDPRGIIASPLPTLNIKSLVDAIEKIHRISKSQGAELILIGLPLGPNGEETQQSIKVRYFGDTLSRTNGTPVEYWNESFTTQIAQKGPSSKKKRANFDSEAARIILQEFLDNQSESRPKIYGPELTSYSLNTKI